MIIIYERSSLKGRVQMSGVFETNRRNASRWRNSTKTSCETMAYKEAEKDLKTTATEKQPDLRFSSDFVLESSVYSSDADSRQRRNESKPCLDFVANDMPRIDKSDISGMTKSNGAAESHQLAARLVHSGTSNTFPPEIKSEAVIWHRVSHFSDVRKAPILTPTCTSRCFRRWNPTWPP